MTTWGRIRIIESDIIGDDKMMILSGDQIGVFDLKTGKGWLTRKSQLVLGVSERYKPESDPESDRLERLIEIFGLNR